MRKEEIFEILKQIIDMGLVKEQDIEIKGNSIEIMYYLTAPLCPFGAAIGIMIRYVLEKKLGKKVEVKIKPGHYQENAVNAILQDEEKSKELFKKLEQYGVLEQCIHLNP